MSSLWQEPHTNESTSVLCLWPGDEYWGVETRLTRQWHNSAWHIEVNVAHVGKLTFAVGFDFDQAKAHAEKVTRALVALRKPNAEGGLR